MEIKEKKKMIQHTMGSNGQAEKITQKLGSICKSKLKTCPWPFTGTLWPPEWVPREEPHPHCSVSVLRGLREHQHHSTLCTAAPSEEPGCHKLVSWVGDGRWWSTTMLEWVLGVGETWLVWKIKHLPSLGTINCSWQWWMELDIWRGVGSGQGHCKNKTMIFNIIGNYTLTKTDL